MEVPGSAASAKWPTPWARAAPRQDGDRHQDRRRDARSRLLSMGWTAGVGSSAGPSPLSASSTPTADLTRADASGTATMTV